MTFILNDDDLDAFDEALSNGHWLAEFQIGDEGKRQAMLETVEKIFDIAEKADQIVSEMLFGDGQQASKLAGRPGQEE
jgi:hypothetical protein